MSRGPKKTSGGQPGNQNARKHGFYSTVLTPCEEKLLPSLAIIKGLNRDIAVAQVKVLSIMASEPQNAELLFRALGSVRRLAREQSIIERRASTGAKRTAEDVLNSLTRFHKNESRS